MPAFRPRWRRGPGGEDLCRIVPRDLELGGGQPALDLPFREGRALAAEEWSRRAVTAALAATRGHVTRAAQRLKMNTGALFRLLKKYGTHSE